jgi:hypothetical protein
MHAPCTLIWSLLSAKAENTIGFEFTIATLPTDQVTPNLIAITVPQQVFGTDANSLAADIFEGDLVKFDRLDC